MIVVDSSALAKYLLREKGWSNIEGFLVERVCSVDHVLKEVSNAIWKYVVLLGKTSTDHGLELFKQLRKLVDTGIIVLENQDKYLDKAVEIAFKHGITVYDSLYIAQASQHDGLLTCDSRQKNVAEKLGIRVYYVQ